MCVILKSMPQVKIPNISYLGLHGVTDGDVPLDGEGCQGERRGVHGEELGVDHEGAAEAAPDPHVAQDVVGEHLLGHLMKKIVFC